MGPYVFVGHFHFLCPFLYHSLHEVFKSLFCLFIWWASWKIKIVEFLGWWIRGDGRMMSTERAWKLHTTSHVLSMQLFHPAVAKPAVSSADPAGEGTGLLLQVFLPYRGSHATEDLHRVNLEAILLFKRIKMKLKILLCYGIHENIFSQFLACLCIFYNVSDL